MNRRLVIDLLRLALIAAVLAIALVQILFLPWLSGELARDLPAEAYLRWPILALAVTGLLCVQAGIVCVVALLTRIRADRFFTERSLRWVDGLTAAFARAVWRDLLSVPDREQPAAVGTAPAHRRRRRRGDGCSLMVARPRRSPLVGRSARVDARRSVRM